MVFRGIHPLWGNDAFPPCFGFLPYFRKTSQTPWKIFPILPFPEKFLDFHPPKFLMTVFLVIDYKCWISPYFPVSLYFPLFRENYYFLPTFTPLFSGNVRVFLHTLCVFRFPPTLTMMHLCITQCTYWTPLMVLKLGEALKNCVKCILPRKEVSERHSPMFQPMQ